MRSLIGSGSGLVGRPGAWLPVAILGILGTALAAEVGCASGTERAAEPSPAAVSSAPKASPAAAPAPALPEKQASVVPGQGPAAATPDMLKRRAEIEAAIARACAFGETLQHGGGWAKGYSLDLQKRNGEYTPIGPEVVVIQPSTAEVAIAYLWAYKATGQAAWLDTAKRTGDLLVRYQQLYPHGGFPYEMWISQGAPDGLAGCHAEQFGKPYITDLAVFDDACTDLCIWFLDDLARVSGQEKYRRAWEKGLQCYLDAQYPNGGWPQCYPYARGYGRYYTLNDGVTLNAIRSLIRAWRLTGQKKYFDAAVRGGEWLIAARQNGPTFGWAEQYDMDMKPAQARAYEPPSTSGNTTRMAMEALMDVFEITGDKKFLAPLPKAIEWLDKARLPDSGDRPRWARFYALDAEAKPVYGTPNGTTLSLDVKDAKPGYGWQGTWGLPTSIERYKGLAALSEADLRETVRRAAKRPAIEDVPTMSPRELDRGESSAAALDAEGRWVDSTRPYPISMGRFAGNLTAMAKRVIQIRGRQAVAMGKGDVKTATGQGK